MTNQEKAGPPAEPSPPIRWIVSFFLSGYLPWVPGTWGSLAAFPLYFLLVYLGDWRIYLAAIIFITAIGVWAATRAERQSNIVDPSFVVIDEVAGQLVTLFLIPFSWKAAFAGFVLFRLLDIFKPFPARRFERLPGGWGVMADDVMAGIYGNLLLRLAILLFHRWYGSS